MQREESAAATLVDLGGTIKITPGVGFTASLEAFEAEHWDCEEAALLVLEQLQCDDAAESRQRDRETIRNFRHFMWATKAPALSETARPGGGTSVITAALLAALAGAGPTLGCGCPACAKKRQAKGGPPLDKEDAVAMRAELAKLLKTAGVDIGEPPVFGAYRRARGQWAADATPAPEAPQADQVQPPPPPPADDEFGAIPY